MPADGPGIEIELNMIEHTRMFALRTVQNGGRLESGSVGFHAETMSALAGPGVDAR
jgi:hypothetical protein